MDRNAPFPLPLAVRVGSDIVGFSEVDHTTPFSVTSSPPSFATSPPQIASVLPIEVTSLVVTNGLPPVLKIS